MKRNKLSSNHKLSVALTLLCLSSLSMQEARSIKGGYQKPKTTNPSKLTASPLKNGLPENFSWQNKDGVNDITTSKNQHIPHYCESGWAFASAHAMSDRISIARGAAFPEISISPRPSSIAENRPMAASEEILRPSSSS